MALISCFAMLMFVLVGISFLYYKCDTKKFVSWNGTTTYNIWALIYETIETSTIDSIIKCLPCDSFDKPSTAHRDDSRGPNTGSASLGFTTNTYHHQISQAQWVSQGGVRNAMMSHALPMETMATTFVNQYGLDFQARIVNYMYSNSATVSFLFKCRLKIQCVIIKANDLITLFDRFFGKILRELRSL
jgi:hypothetical protein